ncbi:MAG TPA: hypothetical protein PLO61_08075 [Fimbriimonadaceae bacterium]|nr:hypothetical protein [Fimbriimonadaceae bacterium]HRJ33426.1 hypothetical protein [Fimbriimonadaceae bacterium]
MSPLAEWLARRLWWLMLKLMRTRGMRRAQTYLIRRAPPERAAKMLANLHRQNRLARKIGLKLLTIAMQLLLASVIITLVVMGVLYLAEIGALKPPRELKS